MILSLSLPLTAGGVCKVLADEPSIYPPRPNQNEAKSIVTPQYTSILHTPC
jgi:hypothetical protein